MTTAHARNSPSGWSRWSACAGALNLTESLLEAGRIPPDTSSKYADEGTAAHAAAAWCLQMGLDGKDVIGEVFDGIMDFPVNDDMAMHIQVYLDYVRRQPGELHVEQSLYIGPIEDKGTTDAAVITEHTLTVIDLKYGRGVKVNAQGNGQLMLYADGALTLCPREPKTIRLVIVQPRLDHIDEHEITIAELRAFQAAAREQVAASRKPDAPRTPGNDQCKFCPAKGHCPELAAWATGTVDTAPADLLTNDQVGDLLPRLAAIEDWVEAVRARAHAELMSGREIPGHKLVLGRGGARKWSDPAAAEELLRSFRLPVDDMYDKTVVSPTAAEKLLAETSPRRWAKVQPLIVRSDPKPTVVSAKDKRPAVVINPVLDQIPDLTAEPAAPTLKPVAQATVPDDEFADLC